MDPQATWTELLEAREQGAWDRAEELANALLDWMDRKGFPPMTVGSQSLGKGWHRTIAHFVCILTLNNVRDARKRSTKKRA
jgi:hypothetical protein